MLTGLLAQAAAHPASDVMSMLDVVLFCVAVVGVIGLGIYKARPKKEEKEKRIKAEREKYLGANRKRAPDGSPGEFRDL